MGRERQQHLCDVAKQPVAKVAVPAWSRRDQIPCTEGPWRWARPAARPGSPLWVTTADLPTNAGHPFFERLNRVLDEAGFDAYVEGLCAVFYAAQMGRPSLRPGRYFRMLLIGYFEGLSSERGIAWRVADSLSLRSFLDLDVTEASPDHSTLSRTRRLIDVETHEAVFTWVLERLSAAGLLRGKTVGVDATTLEANAAMRSIERRDTGESYEAFIRRLAEASGVETPTRAELARFDRSRKNKKDVEQGLEIAAGPGREDREDEGRPDALGSQGRARGRHGHGGRCVGDGAGCLRRRYGHAADDADHGGRAGGVGAAGRSRGRRAGRRQGYHSDETPVALGEVGLRSYVSEPERGRRCWQECARLTGGGWPVRVRQEEGVTNHLHPESCAGCEAAGEALTGARTGRAIEYRIARR